MGDRKWENLPLDCLVNIFSRVGVMSLLEGVPFVCKPWYEATLSPLCWQSLFFPYFKEIRGQNAEKFVKFVISRSHGLVNVVTFNSSFPLTQKAIECIGDGCPSLKSLVLPPYCSIKLSHLICKWKYLEALDIMPSSSLRENIPEISLHCKKFVSLTVSDEYIGVSVADAISTFLPNIEFLSFDKGSTNKRQSLMKILKCCKKLVHFDAGQWMAFDADDEIMDLAAGIVTFTYEVSKFEYHSDDSDYGFNDFELDLEDLDLNLEGWI